MSASQAEGYSMAMAPYKSGGGGAKHHHGGMLLPLTVSHFAIPAMLVAGPKVIRAMKIKGPTKKKSKSAKTTGKAAPSKSKKKKSSKSKK